MCQPYTHQMTDFVIFPIDRTWCTIGSLSQFVVDIVEDSGLVRRGYVCDKSENGLLVKGSSGKPHQLVPFHRLRLPNDDMGDISSTVPQDIEVLINLNTDCETWMRATLISSCKCSCSHYGDHMRTCTLLCVNLEDCQPPIPNTRCILIDGDIRQTQRARRRKLPSLEITANTFYKLIVPMPQPTRECPDPASSLRKAARLPRFHEFWLSCAYAQFVASSDDHVEVLRLRDSKLTRTAESTEKYHYRSLVTRCILYVLPGYLERFDKLCSAAARDMMNDMVSAVVRQKDEFDAYDPHYQDLPVVIHVMVLLYLDVYDQNLLKRVSKFLKFLLDTLYVQTSAVIPANAAPYDVGSLEGASYWQQKNSFTLSHVILRSVTRNVKILYLTGTWINCLLPVTCLLSLMSVKLDWLVIAQNPLLQINEFQRFPQLQHTMSDCLPIPIFWNICRSFALKSVSFSSEESICFSYPGSRILPASRNCCYKPFRIPVGRWSVNLDGSSFSAEHKWNTSVRLMFHKFCPQMNSEEIRMLMGWLNRTDVSENMVLWACVCRCFSLWGVQPPGDAGSLRRVVVNRHYLFINPAEPDPNAAQRLQSVLSRDFPEKNIVMRTLALLIPHADCGQQLPNHMPQGV